MTQLDAILAEQPPTPEVDKTKLHEQEATIRERVLPKPNLGSGAFTMDPSKRVEFRKADTVYELSVTRMGVAVAARHWASPGPGRTLNDAERAELFDWLLDEPA